MLRNEAECREDGDLGARGISLLHGLYGREKQHPAGVTKTKDVGLLGWCEDDDVLGVCVVARFTFFRRYVGSMGGGCMGNCNRTATGACSQAAFFVMLRYIIRIIIVRYACNTNLNVIVMFWSSYGNSPLDEQPRSGGRGASEREGRHGTRSAVVGREWRGLIRSSLNYFNSNIICTKGMILWIRDALIVF